MTNITCPDCGGFAPLRVTRCEYCANDRVAELEAEVERLRAERDAARKALPLDLVVGIGRLVGERDAAREAAARWRNRARFWRRVADQTSMWTGPRFYKRVLQLSRRWRRGAP